MYSYDEVQYPNFTIAQSHPDKIAVVATMLGMTPAAPERARVLDIGCSAGGNLLPMAVLFPEAEFVGIDLAATPIAQAANATQQLGLKNVRFEQMDVMDLPESLGTFDYILAHGFMVGLTT